MKYIECPEEYLCTGSDLTLFLGGGISGCKNWQAEVVDKLFGSDLTLLNPRRGFKFKKDDEASLREQIAWEHRHMLRANAITFWFPPEAVASMTIYELGAWNFRPKKLFIGFDPTYTRTKSFTIQTQLERPFQEFVYNLDDMVKLILEWEQRKKQDRFSVDNDQPLNNK